MTFEAMDPSAARLAGERRIGGKAQGLSRLDALAAAVPAWWVIPVEGLAAHLAHPALRAPVAAVEQALLGFDAARPETLATLEEAARRLREQLEATPLAETARAALARHLPRLGAGPYAVRSSMVGEDSERQSFAGQLESFLFQRTADEVAASVVRCWASAFSSRALRYALAGGRRAVPAVAVVVQRMIGGAVSGVLFTAHPVTGRRDHALLTAAWGLGEGVVSGRCNTDEYVWSRAGGEVSAKLADKDLEIVAAAGGAGGGAGVAEAAVAAARRGVRCLSAAQVAQICGEGLRLAEALGAPQDIEWTIDEGGALHLLQARPITSLRPDEQGGPRIVWNNSNIQESYCGVTTPLTFSLARAGYTSVYVQFLRVLGMPERAIAEHLPVFRNMIGLVRGRVYYNINNWYRLLRVLPSFGRNKVDMERMMGLDRSVDFIEDQRFSWWQKAARAPRLLRNELRLCWRFARLDGDVARFLREFEERTRYDRAAFASWPMSRLMETLERLRGEVMERWHTPIVNDFYVMRTSGRLRRLVTRTGRGDAAALLGRIMAGEPGIESTEPTRLLMRMARRAREEPGLAELLRGGAPLEALRRIREEFPAFAATFDEYIERYGDRCMGELKLETISHREDPGFVVTMLRNYLDRDDLDPDELGAREQAARAEAVRVVRRALPWHLRGRLRRTVASARRAVKHRENMRLSRTRAFGLSRDLWKAVGLRLHEAGRLDHPRDVFYLSRDEIRDYFEGMAVAAELAPLARARKAEFARYRAQELPNHFETVGPVHHGNDAAFDEREAAPAGEGGLRGTGCYPGVVEAAVKVIMSPEDELTIDRDILCTLRTDPGWAPLFPTASGILVERGSTLSHSAVLARELGIPAIVGVPRLLARLASGDRVRMNGGTGEIELLAPAAASAPVAVASAPVAAAASAAPVRKAAP